MKTTTGYSGIQIVLHWLVAVLLAIAWFTGEGANAALERVEEGGTAGFVPHVALGLAILALAVLRVLVRLGRGAPEPAGEVGSLQVRAAGWVHLALYVLMIAVPLGGISAWFLGLETGEIHGLFANLLMALALGHAALAIYHQVVLKDGTLTRMTRAE
ncbi:cytochrome b [Tabrizicola flagellatus]|uniref:cytochrome b n=1 Tax=Tabrizicola flagellatus TaxID=2593021 RepID=UPI0013589993|nr:cytochrome b/b6 domain-containing protein [Tabrizicola flagellatus]